MDGWGINYGWMDGWGINYSCGTSISSSYSSERQWNNIAAWRVGIVWDGFVDSSSVYHRNWWCGTPLGHYAQIACLLVPFNSQNPGLLNIPSPTFEFNPGILTKSFAITSIGCGEDEKDSWRQLKVSVVYVMLIIALLIRCLNYVSEMNFYFLLWFLQLLSNVRLSTCVMNWIELVLYLSNC